MKQLSKCLSFFSLSWGKPTREAEYVCNYLPPHRFVTKYVRLVEFRNVGLSLLCWNGPSTLPPFSWKVGLEFLMYWNYCLKWNGLWNVEKLPVWYNGTMRRFMPWYSDETKVSQQRHWVGVPCKRYFIVLINLPYPSRFGTLLVWPWKRHSKWIHAIILRIIMLERWLLNLVISSQKNIYFGSYPMLVLYVS